MAWSRRQNAPQQQPQQPAQPEPPQNGGDGKKKPVWKVQMPVDGGNIQIALWEREITVNNNNITVYSATIQYSYFDAKEKTWKTNDFIRAGALPALAHGLLKAFDYAIEARSGATPF